MLNTIVALHIYSWCCWSHSSDELEMKEGGGSIYANMVQHFNGIGFLFVELICLNGKWHGNCYGCNAVVGKPFELLRSFFQSILFDISVCYFKVDFNDSLEVYVLWF